SRRRPAAAQLLGRDATQVLWSPRGAAPAIAGTLSDSRGSACPLRDTACRDRCPCTLSERRPYSSRPLRLHRRWSYPSAPSEGFGWGPVDIGGHGAQGTDKSATHRLILRLVEK